MNDLPPVSEKQEKSVGAEGPAWLTPNLVLGWKMTKGFQPQYWAKETARPGAHSLTDVVLSVPKSIAHHTAIIAQSGSGKSYFLGRLIEEILLKTRSRVLIMDPNSDFRKIAQPKLEDNWKQWHDKSTGKWFLVDEPTQKDFLERWNKVTVRLHGEKEEPRTEFLPLQVDWLDFPVDILADEVGPYSRDELHHCHSFVNLLATLAWETKNEKWLKKGEFLPCANDLCRNTTGAGTEKIISAIRELFGLPSIQTAEFPRFRDELKGVFSLDEVIYQKLRSIYPSAVKHIQFVSHEAVAMYFRRAFQLEAAGVIHLDIGSNVKKRDRKRVEVIDLPSVRDRYHQKLVISSFLQADWTLSRSEWEDALAKPSSECDTRVPTFIVVEEAHNLIPSEPETPIEKKLQEQFRRVAAEGRKFGRYLILVSQRPDKLDRMVVSECENRAVMRLGSNFILQKTCEILGLEHASRMSDKVLDFDFGRALLVGPWVADEPTFLISAARRTEEGGRDLDWKYWAKPSGEQTETGART